MEIRKSVWILLILLGVTQVVRAQSDSSTLTYKEYLENIILFHPIAKKADLKSKLGEAEWLLAKGNLDPKLNFLWNEKNFDEKRYYRQYQGKFKIPTPLGVDVVGGYENTEGVFLNPENITDENGLWHLGVEVNVLQGLIVNERRVALQQAKVFQSMNESERIIILNDLLYYASKAYLEWQKYTAFQYILSENMKLADTYLANTKLSFLNGEKTAIDTLEAFILNQEAIIYSQKNDMDIAQARQQIENFLWYEERPISLKTSVQPESYENEILQMKENVDIGIIVNRHPIIQFAKQKQSYLEIEQKLKREKLKPKLKLKYNPLLATSTNSVLPSVGLSDFKWGVDFSMPLLFRTERADLQKNKIKIQETNLDLQNKMVELTNKTENSLEQQALIRDQIEWNKLNVRRYELLLIGENEKFKYGESSIFLLNKRQEKYINGELKLIESYIKLQKEILNYLYYSNRLIQTE